MAGQGEAAAGPSPGGLPEAGAAAGPGGGSAGASGGGAGAAAMAGIGFVLQKANQAGTALAGRMEQTAAHGGMQGAYPYSTVSAGQRPAPGGGAHGAPGGQFPAETAPQVPDPPAWGAGESPPADERPAGPPGGGPDAPPPDWPGYGREEE